MASHVGVDWAGGTWVVVEATGGSTSVTTQPSLLNVWTEFGDRAEEILVDIPVHLEADGDRDCDREAKDYLKPRGSTVFWTPNSDAVFAEGYPDAVDKNHRGLGCQSWGLIPRIREADALLEQIDGSSQKVLESHPEVCFRSLHDGDLPSKKDSEGFEARKKCLVDIGGDTFQDVVTFVEERQNDAKWHHRVQSGRLDDVLDAAVLALTGLESEGGYSTLPAEADPTTDPSIVVPP